MKYPLIAAAVSLLCLSTSAQAQSTYSGDKKLACEALLCLAAGNRPDECTPPIRKYFSITNRRPDKQLRARKSFLKLCPNVGGNIVDVIAGGAGSCETETLLERLNPQTYQSAIRSGGTRTNYKTSGASRLPDGCREFNELRNVPNPVRRTAYYRSGQFVNGGGRGVQTLYFWEMP